VNSQKAAGGILLTLEKQTCEIPSRILPPQKNSESCSQAATAFGKNLRMNRLFFGDNLGWLRDAKEFPDASVDLI